MSTTSKRRRTSHRRTALDARAVQRSLHEVSPKCHRGRGKHRDGKIWDSNRGCCLNLWWATEEEDGCHGKSLCALA